MIEKGNGYKAHEFEEIAKDNNLEVEVAMDNTMKEDGKCIETSSPLFQETWEMVDGEHIGRWRKGHHQRDIHEPN